MSGESSRSPTRGSASGPRVADRLGVPKSTAHDCLRTLRELGYVVNDAGTYRLGFRPLELGGRTRHRSRLFQVARSELDRAADAVADQGYAVDRNRQVAGMGVVAAPITVDGRVLGSIGLVYPADTLRTEASRAELVAAVQQSANVVSVNYQYSP